jgi:hypothetical protein
MFAAVLGGLLIQTSSVVLAADAPELQGAYYCEGTDASGSPYYGTTVIQKQGDVYYLQWRIGRRMTALGVGIVTGQTLAVSYYGRSTGVALYTIGEGGLIGRWTQPGSTGVIFSETLTRIPASELENGTEPPAEPQFDVPPPTPPGRPI